MSGKVIEPGIYEDYGTKELQFCLKYEKEVNSKEYGYPESVRRGVGNALSEVASPTFVIRA